RVYGWDFPNLADWRVDVNRGLAAIAFSAPGGHHLDGFAADIETASEGTNLSWQGVDAYGAGLRKYLPASYPLIGVVPRPSVGRAGFPYDKVAAHFDALAPMVYWLNRQPDTDVAGALADLSVFHKPLMPVGQAYDGASEGGRPGVPPRAELLRFMAVAQSHGASSVSFWSWQEADEQAWLAIRDAPQFTG
ncbi:MAG: hypothetical protein ACYDAD_07310, partial [Acidimicrobiales bacterium]